MNRNNSSMLPRGPASQRNLDARVPQDKIGRIYDKLSGVYDIWARLTEPRARDRAIELAMIEDGQNTLEVAVGTGLAFQEIVKRNPHGHNLGIDLSTGMLEKARRRIKGLSGANYVLTAGTAFDLPSQTESIDLLMNNYMLDLISYAEMDLVLAEFRRVLKLGGKLVLANMTIGASRGSELYEYVYRVSPNLMGGCRGVQMSDRLSEHGFAVEVREYHQQMLFPSEVILARKVNLPGAK